jgi:hypothetical protein
MNLKKLANGIRLKLVKLLTPRDANKKKNVDVLQHSFRFEDKQKHQIHVCVTIYGQGNTARVKPRIQVNFWDYTANNGWEKIALLV